MIARRVARPAAATAACAVALAVVRIVEPRVTADPGAAPVLIVDTAKGTFAIDTFPADAPKTVAHVVALVRSGFYNRQRVHRAVPGFVVQFGDPQTKDPAKRDVWGLGREASSGTPVGIAEISPHHTHVAGAVGLSHMGEPARADSQIYITLTPHHELDGRYAVFGQVIDGGEIPATLQVGDEIVAIRVRE